MNNKLIFLTAAMLFSLSLASFGQRCQKFINYQTRTINMRGLSLPVNVPANLLPVNIGTLQRATSERLEMLDMLQYNLCQKMANIRVPILKETMEVEYSNFLMEIMGMLVAETAGEGAAAALSAATAQPATTTPQAADAAPQAASQQSQDAQPTAEQQQDAAQTQPVAAEPVPAPLPQATAPPSAGKVRITFPCRVQEADGVIRAFGMKESADPQIARQVAATVALSELASKVEITVKSTIDYHVKRIQNNQDEEFEKRYEMKTEQTVDQTLRGWRMVCEEFELDQGTNRYSAFVVIEISQETVLRPIFNELVKDPELKEALPEFEEFENVFDSMNNIRSGNSLYVGF